MTRRDWPEDIKDAARRICNGMFSGHRELYFDDICRAISDERARCGKLAAPVGPYSSEWSDYEKQAYDLRTVIHRAIVNGEVAR